MSEQPHLAQAMQAAMRDADIGALACRTGLSRQQIRRYAGGEALPRADVYLKICAALDIDPWMLIRTAPGGGQPGRPPTLTELTGNATVPTETQLPSGIYEAYIGLVPVPGVVLRYFLQIGGSARGRVSFARVPARLYPSGTARIQREVNGRLVMKFGHTVMMISTATAVESNERKVSVAHFGPPTWQNGWRQGISMMMDDSAVFNPLVTRSALILTRHTSYARAYRRTAVVSLDQAPEPVQDYFLSPSLAPHTL